MRILRTRRSLTVALLTAAIFPAAAGGFQLNLAAQKNIGMAHTGTGLALDQGAMFFNPGALTFVKDRGIVLGASATFSRTAYQNETGTISQFKHKTATPFQLYAGFGPKEGKFRAGIAIYTPFGAQLNYGSEWSGRYALTNIQLAAGYIQPTVAYQLTPWLGIGAGFVYALGYVSLEKDLLLPFADPATSRARIKLETEKPASGTGFNAGIFLKPMDKLTVGISYRSKVDMKVKESQGKLTTTEIGTVDAVRSEFQDTQFSATLPLPATTSIGVGVMPSEKLTIAADFNFVQWSAYKELRFDFKTPIGGNLSSTSVRNYQDAWTARLGAQYRVADALTLRAGTYYDRTPVRDGYVTPETPDANRIAGTGGLTIHAAENFDIDLAGEFLHFQKRSQSQQDLISNNVSIDRVAGTFETNIVIIGGGISYKF